MNKAQANRLRELIDRFDEVDYNQLDVKIGMEGSYKVVFRTNDSVFTCAISSGGKIGNRTEERTFRDWSV